MCEPPIPIQWEAKWAPVPVKELLKRKKNRVKDIKPLIFGCSAPNFVTIAITPEIPI